MNWSLAKRPYHWFTRGEGSLKLLRLTLLWLVLALVGRGMAATTTYIQAAGMAWTGLLAILTGWLFSRSRLPGWKSGLIAAAIGLLWLALTVGQIGAPIRALLASGPPFVSQLAVRGSVDLQPVVAAWATLVQNLTTLGGRLSLWARGLGGGTSIVDPIMTGLQWGAALWLAAVWAAWWLHRRGSAGIGLMPSGALLAFSIFNSSRPGVTIWLVMMGGGWILVQALQSYMLARRRWQDQHLDRSEIETGLALSVTLLTIGLMLAGGILPSISFEKIRTSIDEFFPDRPGSGSGGTAGGQPVPAGSGSSAASGIGGQPSTHAIGGGVHLSSDVVMYVSVEGYAPLPPANIAPFAPIPMPDVQYYWRSQSYENYNGHVWSTYANQDRSFAAGDSLRPDPDPLAANYKDVRQHVERLRDFNGTLFVSGDLLSVDQPYTVSFAGPDDVVEAQTQADNYVAESRMPYVSENRLRAAGNDYPDPIRSRYLQLPENLPQRVRDLAINLTIDQTNPFDQATVIQDYLRQFPYTLDVTAPPTDRDVADYFLFDLQRGYCDYYATTMVVLARAAGIPSRMVIGFASGGYDYGSNRFVIRQLNAHAWVEVYFPEIGWVQFEPTAIQPRPPHPGSTEDSEVEDLPEPIPTQADAGRLAWAELRKPLQGLGFVLAALLLLSLLPFDTWILYLRPAARSVPAIFRRLYKRSRRWGVPPDASRTPHEFAAALAVRLDRLAGSRRLAPVVEASLKDLDWLTGLYARLLYSDDPPTRQEGRKAIRTWSHLRRSLGRLNR